MAALASAEYAYVPAAITAASLAALMVLGSARAYARRRRNLSLFNKRSLEEERNVLRAVSLANKGGKATGKAVAASYQRLTGEQIQPDRLFEKLHEAEEAGLVERAITSREDEPILVWKTQSPTL